MLPNISLTMSSVSHTEIHQGVLQRLRGLGITDLVVWGLKTNTHTHHYIHRAVFYYFKHIAPTAGMRVHWYDDQPQSRLQALRWNFTPRRQFLFFASPHYEMDKHLPLISNGRYILHADWNISWPTKSPITKYSGLLSAYRAVRWRVFRGYPTANEAITTLDLSELTFFNHGERRLTMPWATDLVPSEVDRNIESVQARYRNSSLFPGNQALFVGSVWDRNRTTMERFEIACRTHGLNLRVERIEALDDLIAATQDSHMAPSIQGLGHRRSTSEFYVPDRIFKNISYGALAVSNNGGVKHLLGDAVIFDVDELTLVAKYEKAVGTFDSDSLDAAVDLMRTVRDRHTYGNRLYRCLQFLV